MSFQRAETNNKSTFYFEEKRYATTDSRPFLPEGNGVVVSGPPSDHCSNLKIFPC